MLKPKPRGSRRYWENLADEQLLDAQLTTDDPEGLDGLVPELPPGNEEPYVEYKYDLRGQERDMLRCVHGNHPHLAGFVMRKGPHRFLVGHICGNHIYGEDFDAYTADFNAAINRQDALRRRREIERATKPFLAWFTEVLESPVFSHYRSISDRMFERMPWIYDNLPRAAALAGPQAAVRFPPTLFGEKTDPEAAFVKIAGEFNAAVMSLIAMSEKAVNMDPVQRHFEMLLRRIEALLDQLREIEDFFQPAVLDAICRLANEWDKPDRRKYVPGLLTLTCKRKKDEVAIKIPHNYRVPDKAAIDAFRKALRGVVL